MQFIGICFHYRPLVYEFRNFKQPVKNKATGNVPVRCMQYKRFPVGKSRKNRVTDKESEGFAYLCTNLNDWGMSDIFNSSHFLRALMKSYQASQENQGAAEISWGSRRGRALHIANTLTLPFYLLPFYLLRGGRRTWKRETHTSVTGRRGKIPK